MLTLELSPSVVPFWSGARSDDAQVVGGITIVLRNANVPTGMKESIVKDV